MNRYDRQHLLWTPQPCSPTIHFVVYTGIHCKRRNANRDVGSGWGPRPIQCGRVYREKRIKRAETILGSEGVHYSSRCTQSAFFRFVAPSPPPLDAILHTPLYSQMNGLRFCYFFLLVLKRRSPNPSITALGSASVLLVVNKNTFFVYKIDKKKGYRLRSTFKKMLGSVGLSYHN